MEEISRLGLSASWLYGAFSEIESVFFLGAGFFSGEVWIWLSFYSMKNLFLKIKGLRILLNQGDQLLIGLIKFLQVSNDQEHLIVQIGVDIVKSYK